MFMAEITAVHVDERYVDEKGAYDFGSMELVAFNHGKYYRLEAEEFGFFGFSVMKPKTAKRKAAEKGATDALFNLGNIYYSGIGGLKRDYSKAAEYFEKYLDIVPDDKEALHLLGRCYVFMEEHDLLKAEELFATAASLGNELAAKDLDALQIGGQIIDY